MHYYTYADKDATIYSGSTDDGSVGIMNTGIDEILEIDKRVSPYVQGLSGTTDSVSRTVVKFDISDISESIADGTISDYECFLNLYTVNATEIPYSYTLSAYAISSDWDMGLGRKHNVPLTSDGVTWHWKAGSYQNYWTLSGGDYSDTAEATQSFEFETTDIRMNVTDIFDRWLSGSAKNYGLIVKHSGSEETDSNNYGLLQFYSRDTHTIYPPTLEICWDDSSWDAGELSALDTTGSEYTIYMRDLRESYRQTSKSRFRLVGREKYPIKTFSTSSDYTSVKYLPSASTYYSIHDVHTAEVITDFSEYTKISCDGNGNYFDLWMNGLQPERYYKFVFKVENHGLVDYHDNDFIFKVVR